ncbi:MAG: hydantoinase B/oxoprolinase family protein [Rhizobiaceae bacterium]
MKLDPIKLEIIGKKFSAVLDEMYFAIQRASRSSYVKEAADFSTGVLDVDGNIFAYPPSATFNFLVDSYFVDTIRAVPDVEPGDVILTNDPYLSNGLSTHLPDYHLLRPYFYKGKPIGYGWSFVHCPDVGGAVPTSMSPGLTDIFQEGIRLPPMKLVKAGAANEELFGIIKANTRTPDTVIGDLKAMLGALGIGEIRFGELADRFGIDDISQAARDLQDYAAAKAREVLRMIPDGAYEFWDYMDDDYVSRIPVRIRARMTVKDGEVLIDLSDTDPQVKAGYNVPTLEHRMYWVTFRLTSFITTFDPSIPKNTGMFRHITVKHQKGSILNAEFPDAVNIRASAPYRLFDALTGALIQARPDLMPAATGGTMSPFAYAEPSDDGASRKVEVIEPLRCGMGAFVDRDGVDARDNSLNNMRNHPLELVEHNSSILVIDYDIRQDSGGPGKFRGGVGQLMTVQALRDDGVIVARGMERLRFQPYGIGGGKPGAILRAVFNIGQPDERELGKIHELKMGKGDTLTLMMPGGGGYGDPFERDPALVLQDVRNGFVGIEAAERDYGVVIREDSVDMAATEATRSRREQLPRNEQFDFGPDREAWEAVFDDAAMHDINTRLYALPKSRRQMLRRTLFETVVPGLANGHSGSLSELLHPTDDTRRRLRREIERLLPKATAASN